MSPEEVLSILSTNPDNLIGTPESSQVDFKSDAYELGSPKGKWELAKDVAGIANLSGGVIVIGIRTTKTEGNFLEVASSVVPLPASSLNKDQYHSIIRDMVRPAVEFEINFFEAPGRENHGYMTIQVKSLKAVDRWAIVRRMINDESRLLDAMGVPIRDSDQTRWLSADEVYRLIRDGQRSNDLSFVSAVPEDSSRRIDSDEAVDRLIEYKDWRSSIVVWQSIPQGEVDLLPRLWSIDGVAQALRHPPTLRPGAGFNWHFMSAESQFDGGILASDGRHAIWVGENGLITAVATVEDMLSWGTNSPEGGPHRLNLVALIETTLEYYRLVDSVLIPEAGASYMHMISTRQFTQGKGVSLPGHVNPNAAIEFYLAGQDVKYKFSATPMQPERDAYEALWRMFAVFRQAPERIPFAIKNQISTDEFLTYLKSRPL